MPLTPFPVEQFGGLNIVSDPTEVGTSAATDLLNVSFDQPGRLRTRDGYVKFSTSASPVAINYLVPIVDTQAGSPRFVAITNQQVDAFDMSTGVRTTPVGTGTYGTAVTHITRPTLYSPDLLGAMAVWASDHGTTGAHPQASDGIGGIQGILGFPQYVCTVPSRGTSGLAPRLAQAGYFAAADTPSGANGSFSTVFFSKAGASGNDLITGPSVGWPSTNWVQLDPGDGEQFTGMVGWDGSLFLFKSTKVFEFFAESTLSDGSPVFNYRRVSLPDPIPQTTAPTAWQPVAVGPDGVYYAGSRGLWRVGHGGVSRVPTPIDSILSGTASSSFAVGTVGAIRMEWVGPLLSINYALGSGAQRVLVWDTTTNAWTLQAYAKTLSTLPLLAPTHGSDLFFGATDGNIYQIAPSHTDDNGTAISWSYTTGYSSAGGYFRQRIVSSGERKKHFKTDILGSGTVTHQLLTLNGRPNDVADTGAAVTLGTAPAIARGSRRRGARGTHFAHKLSGSGAAAVSGLTYWLSEISLDT
jgi:hypothetical protein